MPVLTGPFAYHADWWLLSYIRTIALISKPLQMSLLLFPTLFSFYFSPFRLPVLLSFWLARRLCVCFVSSPFSLQRNARIESIPFAVGHVCCEHNRVAQEASWSCALTGSITKNLKNVFWFTISNGMILHDEELPAILMLKILFVGGFLFLEYIVRSVLDTLNIT